MRATFPSASDVTVTLASASVTDRTIAFTLQRS